MASDADLAAQVAFLSGVDADGTVAATSFATWNQDTPATYGSEANEFKWGPGTPGTSGGTVTYAFDDGSDFSDAEKHVFEAGLALWSDEADIAFAPAAPGQAGNITFARNDTGDAYEDDQTPPSSVGADTLPNPSNVIVTVDTSPQAYGPIDKPLSFGAFPLSTLVHEEGHALGLGHTGPYNGGTAQSADAAQFGPYDNQLYSVMSYIPPDDAEAPAYDAYAAYAAFPNAETPMTADILAMQRLYGPPTDSALCGGQTFGFNCNIADASRLLFDFTENRHPAVTLFDTGTGNTLDLSGFPRGSDVDLAPGGFTSCAGETDNIAIAPGTRIDRVVTGDGDDTITGNADNDAITGGGGHDVLSGGGGHDAFVFGPGFGHDAITDFAAFGAEADGLRFSGGQFASLADALRHTTMSDAGAVIHVDPQDSVTLLGVSRSDLVSHPRDIMLV